MMTNMRFMDMVRQYAAQAQRRRVSYAEPVRVLVDLRVQAIKAENLDVLDEAKAIEKVESFVTREYGKWDEGFSIPPVG